MKFQNMNYLNVYKEFFVVINLLVNSHDAVADEI